MKGYLLGVTLLTACGSVQAEEIILNPYSVWIGQHCGNNQICIEQFRLALGSAYEYGMKVEMCITQRKWCHEATREDEAIKQDFLKWRKLSSDKNK